MTRTPPARAAAVFLIATLYLLAAACGAGNPTATSEAPISATETATVTSEPSPTTTLAATPTVAPMQINRVNFGSPVSGTVFEELLARMPDNANTRGDVEMTDAAGTLQLLGIERPEPGAGETAWEAHVEELLTTNLNGLSPPLPGWPTELRRYIGGENTLNPYPYTGIDLFFGVDQFITSLGIVVPPEDRSMYDIAFGQFDPGVTEAALAACECNQPDIPEHEGISFYSWGEDGNGDLDRRLAPPFYDHVGRGPRLLVREGEAYYTARDQAMLDYIDTLNGTIPSLADNETYIGAVRWLAALGTMRDITVQADGLSLAETYELYNNPERKWVIEENPLLAPFDLAATGVGFDGERAFTGLVIANPDADTAVTNAALLEERIRNGQESQGTRWSERLGLVEIAVEDRFVIARLYSRDPMNLTFTYPLSYTLIVHE